jgi:hypothetical protein
MRMPHVGKWAVLTALLATQAAVSASVAIRTEPILAGDTCVRCKRIILERHVAAELLSPHDGSALKFRTVRCMLLYMQTARDPGTDVFVVDYSTGKLIRATEAVYVPVAIDMRTGIPNYGVGNMDYLAFKSTHEADRAAYDYGVATLSWSAVQYYSSYLPFRGEIE